jgi:hypothetical protein
MTPERMSRLVKSWVRYYTRGLPAEVAARRVEELDADLHDQIARERAAGVREHVIARHLASRMVRGVPADAAWRGRHGRATDAAPGPSLTRSALRVSTGVALVLLAALVGTLVSDEWVWTLADFVFVGALLTTIGVVFEVAARRAGSRTLAVCIALLGVAAAVVGEADDAPGLVLLGMALIASACAVAWRRRQHAQ